MTNQYYSFVSLVSLPRICNPTTGKNVLVSRSRICSSRAGRTLRTSSSYSTASGPLLLPCGSFLSGDFQAPFPDLIITNRLTNRSQFDYKVDMCVCAKQSYALLRKLCIVRDKYTKIVANVGRSSAPTGMRGMLNRLRINLEGTHHLGLPAAQPSTADGTAQ